MMLSCFSFLPKNGKCFRAFVSSVLLIFAPEITYAIQEQKSCHCCMPGDGDYSCLGKGESASEAEKGFDPQRRDFYKYCEKNGDTFDLCLSERLKEHQEGDNGLRDNIVGYCFLGVFVAIFTVNILVFLLGQYLAKFQLGTEEAPVWEKRREEIVLKRQKRLEEGKEYGFCWRELPKNISASSESAVSPTSL